MTQESDSEHSGKSSSKSVRRLMRHYKRAFLALITTLEINTNCDFGVWRRICQPFATSYFETSSLPREWLNEAWAAANTNSLSVTFFPIKYERHPASFFSSSGEISSQDLRYFQWPFGLRRTITHLSKATWALHIFVWRHVSTTDPKCPLKIKVFLSCRSSTIRLGGILQNLLSEHLTSLFHNWPHQRLTFWRAFRETLLGARLLRA